MLHSRVREPAHVSASPPSSHSTLLCSRLSPSENQGAHLLREPESSLESGRGAVGSQETARVQSELGLIQRPRLQGCAAAAWRLPIRHCIRLSEPRCSQAWSEWVDSTQPVSTAERLRARNEILAEAVKRTARQDALDLQWEGRQADSGDDSWLLFCPAATGQAVCLESGVPQG